ncbi:MAG: tetratricopeptide repeat protein [Saprospiraceae bacterium]|nr:tetratricopeptide repeat protein [Saprospiraceae bacterium]
MNRDEQIFDTIEAYLRGNMPAPDAAAFEAEIAADPELARLVKIHRLERQGLEWLVERDLLAKMNAWEREAGQQQPAPALRVTFVRRWWAAGVAAMLLLGVFGWWLLQPASDIGGPPPVVSAPKPKPQISTPPKTIPRPAPQPSSTGTDDDRVAGAPRPKSSRPEPSLPQTVTPSVPAPAVIDYSALAATYYKEADFIKKSGNGAAESPGYGQALDSYRSGKFGEVEKLLKPVLKLNPNALKTKELLAHSLYKNGRYDEAIPYFRQLADSSDKAISQRSEWALALTLLHKMPGQKALLNRALDKIIAQPGHTFYGKAKEMKGKVGE